MALQMHSNDNAREGRPSVWIFQGRSVVLLVIGAGMFIGLFRILDAAGVDWPLNIAVSILPLALMCSLCLVVCQRQAFKLCVGFVYPWDLAL